MLRFSCGLSLPKWEPRPHGKAMHDLACRGILGKVSLLVPQYQPDVNVETVHDTVRSAVTGLLYTPLQELIPSGTGRCSVQPQLVARSRLQDSFDFVERHAPMDSGNSSGTLNPIHLRPTVMEVDLDALAHNFNAIQSYVAPAAVMPIIKSNAYGHGILACGRHLERIGAKMIGVALLEEGIQLRQGGVTIPILVLGGIFGSQIQYFLDYDLDLVASSVFKLEAVEECAKRSGKRARVHIEIDTGMERIGVHYYSAASLLERAAKCTHVDIIGISSHFATADDPDSTFMNTQLSRFLESCSYLEKAGLPTPTRHIAASAAILRSKATHLDMVRPGVLLYGISPAKDLRGAIDLRPVMSLHSKVVYFKVVKKGAGVSYGLTWTAPEDTRVVTVPIGYGDGYVRRLSNRGQVLINGKRYPIVGRVCMDQLMVNIGPTGTAYNGDDVVLLGEQNGERITVEEITEHLDGNPREFLVSTNLRVPRLYKRGGETFLD